MKTENNFEELELAPGEAGIEVASDNDGIMLLCDEGCDDNSSGNTSGGTSGNNSSSVPSDVTTLTIGTFCSGCICEPNDAEWYKFVANGTTNKYTIYTSGYTDVIGHLYDSSGNLIAYNDDCDGYVNFRINVDLIQGQTYYVRVNVNGNGGGGFMICYENRVDPIKVNSLSISHSNLTLNVGDEVILSTTAYPINATNKRVYWSSSNPEVATVDRHTGKVTIISGKYAKITAITADGSGIKAECSVVVNVCGGDNYKDVNQHSLTRQGEYYVCSNCGHRIKAPDMQDREILSNEDYQFVLCCYLAYLYYKVLEDANEVMIIPTDMLLGKIDEIRSKQQYIGQYDYSDINGVYKVENVLNVPYPGKFNVKCVDVTSLNLFYYNGVLEELISFVTGLLMPGQYSDLFSAATGGDVDSNMYFVFTSLMEQFGLGSIVLLMDLIKLGATADESVQAGDKIINVKYTYGTSTRVVESNFVFSNNWVLKSQQHTYTY